MSYPYRRNNIAKEDIEVYKMISGIYGQLSEWDFYTVDDMKEMIRELYARVVCNALIAGVNSLSERKFNSHEEAIREYKGLLSDCKKSYPLVAFSEGEKSKIYANLLDTSIKALNTGIKSLKESNKKDGK